MNHLHIGIDLDNTIIDYSGVFAPVAIATGLLPADHGLKTKDEVKARLRALAGDDTLWMRLQGQVYGRYIGNACPYDGVLVAVAAFRSRGHRVSIVSHKTRRGHFDPDQVDLWEAASDWLDHHGFVGDSRPIRPADVHYRITREEKVATIADLNIDVFIDDLIEVLEHPAFPAKARRVLFSPEGDEGGRHGLPRARSWQEVVDMFPGLV